MGFRCAGLFGGLEFGGIHIGPLERLCDEKHSVGMYHTAEVRRADGQKGRKEEGGWEGNPPTSARGLTHSRRSASLGVVVVVVAETNN